MTETTTQPFGYTSGYLDWSTGLIKLGARYYDPTLGTFAQPDPAGQGPNPYSYAGNDPTNYTDPTGHNSVSDFFGEAFSTVQDGAFTVFDAAIGCGIGLAATDGSGVGEAAAVGGPVGFAAANVVGCAVGIAVEVTGGGGSLG
jgi:RHS repeat-associated protein